MGNESDQISLADMKKKRAVIKAALTRVRTFVTSFNPRDQALSLLEFRQEALPNINKKFDDIQAQIELLMLDENDVNEAEAERDKFETDYFAIRSQIQELINFEKSHTANGLAHSSFAAARSHRTQLAPIPLPKFNGNIQEWPSFFDIFKALVHNDEDYSPAQKFFHLRSCLEGAALDLVRSIPISDANYDVIIEQLIHRYDNASLVIQSHIRSILDCPRVEEAAVQSLQALYSTVCTHVAALKAMGQPVDQWDAWLVTILVSRLDKATAHSWQLRQRNSELPKYIDLEAFLASRCVALETSESYVLEANGSQRGLNTKKQVASITSRKALITASIKPAWPCPCCKEVHRLYSCEKFKTLKISERLDLVRDKRLCFNCLAPFHTADSCKSSYACRKCKRRHNTILHFEKASEEQLEQEPVSDDQSVSAEPITQSTGAKSMMSLQNPKEVTHVFLATAMVAIRDSLGIYRKCRAILDSGSQVNFVSKRFARQLQLPSKRTIMPISGIGASTTQATNSIDMHLKSCVKNFGVHINCYVLPVIVEELPSVRSPQGGWQIPKEYTSLLADPSFCKSGSIDLLIGCGIFFELMEAKRTPLATGSLCLQESKLGWVVTGGVQTACLLSVGEELESNWRNQEMVDDDAYGKSSKSNLKCIEERQALDHFRATAKRNIAGRFVLRLPFKANARELEDTLTMARCRFLSVERKLQRDDKLRKAYVQFMVEYLAMGHMEKVCEVEMPSQVCYLPHHPIIKTSSLTTKVRVVFDASANGSNGKSLNDILMRGPVVQGDIFTILCRFRKHFYVISADVEKMYRQVAIAREDCDMQRILWRANPSEQLETYRLLTVTYGTTPASFMATQCLASLAEENKLTFPEASKAINKDFYMDDLMTGCESEEECLLLQQQISFVMDSAGLPLRKWCSNSSTIRARLSNLSEDPLFALEIQREDAVKSLGLHWKPVEDEFRFYGVMKENKIRATKRIILSDLNKVFDPLGFLAPVLIKGKIFIQQIWQLKISWDCVLPEDIQDRWNGYYATLGDLRLVSIPRCTSLAARSLIEIHGFCDASQEAYGACVYIRSKDQTDKWRSRLLCARSRVASLKGETIPRLELSGALVLTQLMSKIASAWEVDCSSCYLWTDSTIVLGWLNAQVVRLKVYVANRVTQILEVPEARQWRYISTEENPADVISRGISASDLSKSELWWKGPKWLSDNDNARYPEPYSPEAECELPEQRPLQLSLASVENGNKIFQHYSEWNRLRRGVAWLRRFLAFLRSRNSVAKTSYLTLAELQNAELCILRKVQSEAFPEEVAAYKAHNDLPSKSKLKSLAPFMKEGLILVGGRLSNSDLTEKQKHPIVLPYQHKITKLIFRHLHHSLLHCGPQLLLSAMRQVYWPLKGRLLARSTVLRCISCVRANPKFQIPLMGPLPPQRVQCSRPFTVTGVDFAGPITIRSGVRGRTNKKAWISLFICFSTKAVHLEVVEDLTSQSFIATLRRFMARRGKPKELWSDNGTNFVGTCKELDTYLKDIAADSVKEGISWHFNPPSAPHFGGLWESAVKNTKHHLTRVLKDALLTSSELHTLLCQIEACLNSRPLTPMSSDPSDLQALTPAHFLTGGSMISMHPEPDLTNEDPNCLRRWRYVQCLLQSFWKRWQTEYLPQLQIRGKWTTNTKALAVNDVVIVRDENMPPAKWKLARITSIHPGNDGRIRVVTVRMANQTEMRRPVIKLCRLPVYEEEDC